MNFERLSSRKFIVTMSVVALAGALAFFGKMDGNTAMVLTGCITAYNVANAWTTGKGNGK